MKKNRYLLCLLASGLMLYYAVPRLSLFGQGAERVFSIAWLLFALIVIAGNLTGLLYTPSKNKRKSQTEYNRKKYVKSRQYY